MAIKRPVVVVDEDETGESWIEDAHGHAFGFSQPAREHLVEAAACINVAPTAMEMLRGLRSILGDSVTGQRIDEMLAEWDAATSQCNPA